MYEPIFLYILIGLFMSFFAYGMYTDNDLYGIFSGIFNILIGISILTLKFGSKYVVKKEVVDNTTNIIYETNTVEIPEIIIALFLGVIVLQLLTNISITNEGITKYE